MIDVLSYTLYGDVTVSDVLVFTFAVLFSVIVALLLRTYLRRILRDKVNPDLLGTLEKAVYYAVIVIGVVSVLPQVGVNLTGLLVAGGVVGLIIGFASQSVMVNLISGFFFIFERPFKLGDQISVGDVSGFVEDIRLLSTVVRTYDGIYVRIPNEKIFTSEITNLVANAARRVEYTIGISYSDDAEKAIRVIKETLEDHPFVLRNPPPNIFVGDLGSSSVDIVVRAWTPSVTWYEVKTELLWKIKVELEKAGITIPFPQRVIHFAEKKP
ncbi:MAG: mechanosensitive ion channel family protein [Theionarchaea archaeon]|nr:MAG: mechanosensitive ion channel protein MscS [Theionarchaea archaeon DG-70-1]MBU7026160.1 mechanosensitive ion channel family protein [Theionarchaea archaeon]